MQRRLQHTQPAAPIPAPLHAAWTTRVQNAGRLVLRIAALTLLPFFICGTLAFVSFIYQEALQTTGFACKVALEAEDDAIARAAIERYEQTMTRAQKYQDNWGWLAFWTHPAYREYFFRAAPAQVAAWYAAGQRRGLWKPDSRRFELVKVGDDYRFIDKWTTDPIARLAVEGFDVTLLTQAERYEAAGIEALLADPHTCPINDPADIVVPRKER